MSTVIKFFCDRCGEESKQPLTALLVMESPADAPCHPRPPAASRTPKFDLCPACEIIAVETFKWVCLNKASVYRIVEKHSDENR